MSVEDFHKDLNHLRQRGSRNSELQDVEQHPGRGNEENAAWTTRDTMSSAEPTSAHGANRERAALKRLQRTVAQPFSFFQVLRAVDLEGIYE